MAFADEAYRGQGRFRAVACVSMQTNNYRENHSAVQQSRSESGEIKWQGVNGWNRFYDAKSVFGSLVSLAFSRKLGVDVLIWDTEDSRHLVRHRDDVQNQQNMFRTLFRNVFENRWVGSNNCRDLSVDKQGLKSPERLSRDLDIFNEISVSVREANSREVPLIQVADIFAGTGACSRLNSYEFHSWNKQCQGQ